MGYSICKKTRTAYSVEGNRRPTTKFLMLTDQPIKNRCTGLRKRRTHAWVSECVDLYSALSLRTGDALKMRQEAAVANSWPRHGRCALSLARLVLTPSADQSRRLIDDDLARCVELRPPTQPASQPARPHLVADGTRNEPRYRTWASAARTTNDSWLTHSFPGSRRRGFSCCIHGVK